MRVRLFTLALAEVRLDLDLHSALSTYCATKWRRMISMATLHSACRRYPAGRAGLRACQPWRRWIVACLRLPEKAKRSDLGEYCCSTTFSCSGLSIIANEFQKPTGGHEIRKLSCIEMGKTKHEKKKRTSAAQFPSSWHIHELQVKEMEPVRMTSWYPKFNGSHFGLPLKRKRLTRDCASGGSR